MIDGKERRGLQAAPLFVGWDNARKRIARRLILRGMGEDRRKWERMGLGEEGTSAYASAQWRGGRDGCRVHGKWDRDGCG